MVLGSAEGVAGVLGVVTEESEATAEGNEGVGVAFRTLREGSPVEVTDRVGVAIFLLGGCGSCEAVEPRRELGVYSDGSTTDRARVFGTGKAGRGAFGGAEGVRGGRGMVEVMVVVDMGTS
jgi:hypothetical protein